MTDPYAFADDPSDRGERARSTGDIVITDNAYPAHLMHYENDAVNADVTQVPGGLLERDAGIESPRLMDTQREPRTPEVGRVNCRNLYILPGTNVIIGGRNINRKHLRVWTDANNTSPVFVNGGQGVGSGVAFAANSLPFAFETFYSLYASVPSSATGAQILYIVEEDYYTSDGKR